MCKYTIIFGYMEKFHEIKNTFSKKETSLNASKALFRDFRLEK